MTALDPPPTLDTAISDKMGSDSNSVSSSEDSPAVPERPIETDLEKATTQHTQRTTTSRAGDPVQRVTTAQDWTGPDDPENPFNWPLFKKVYHTTMVGFQCFTMYVIRLTLSSRS